VVGAAACAAALLTGCRRESFRGPLELLEAPTLSGRPARVQRLTLAGQERPALSESARYRVRLPRRPLLTFGVGLAPGGDRPLGRLRMTVRADGQALFRHAFSPRDAREFTDVSVPLEGLGDEVLLEFEVRPAGPAGRTGDAGGALPAIADPVIHDLDDYGGAKGVVLVSIDTLRSDHVGCYGYPRPTTPRIDALARDGLLCLDAVSTSSWTLPAHLSMLTSVDAGEHGGIDGDHGFNRLRPTLASLLRGAGYATRAITSHLYVAPAYGLDEGFERFDFVEDRKAADVAGRAIAQLDAVGDRPFLLFLHFYDPHAHYTPPPETSALFPSAYSGPLKGLLTHFQTLTRATIPPSYLEHLHSLYDAEIRYTDNQLGRVLDHLRRRGLDRSTLVVVTADHGEEFLDHGSWGHGRTLYEEIIRVPLVVHGPGVAPRREAAQASLLDVAPTILAWAGLPRPAHFQGRSLLEPAGARETFGDKGHAKGGARKLFLRGGKAGLKLVLSLDPKQDRVSGEEWFDLAADPAERRPTRPAEAEADAMRRRALSRWREARARGSAGRAVGLTPEQIERLEALGYVGS
jgi:arylsulfatase A-like enzyme